MNTSVDSLVEKISSIKTIKKDILSFPHILLGYFMDMYPEEDELICEYINVIISPMSKTLYEQIESENIDVQKIYDSVEDDSISSELMNSYMLALMRIEGYENLYTEYEKKTEVSQVNQKEIVIDISKHDEEKTAEEYYKLALQQKGYCGIKDKEKYISFLMRASEKGHFVAKHTMALYYLKGKFIPADREKGKILLRECADYGDANSQFEIYEYGKRFPDLFSNQEMFEYLKKAVEQGLEMAKYDLAMMYNENATDEDYLKAVQLLSQCVEKGDASAMYQLALNYRYGHGVVKDMNKAMELLKNAAALGHKRAAEIIGG